MQWRQIHHQNDDSKDIGDTAKEMFALSSHDAAAIKRPCNKNNQLIHSRFKASTAKADEKMNTDGTGGRYQTGI